MCGAADTNEIASHEDIRGEAEQLWEFHMRRLSPKTPPERLLDRVAFSQAPPWRVVRCRHCGLVYRNPVESRHELESAYSDETPPRDTLMALHRAQHASYRAQARRVVAHLQKRGTGLEVGSYVGAFLAAAREYRLKFEGLDINPGVNDFTRSLGFNVHEGRLESFRPDRQFDAVTIWNTFDQLPDPRAAVRGARTLLRAGGLLAIRVPNGDCYARWRERLIDREPRRSIAVQLLAQNNLLTFPYRFGFSPDSLSRMLEELGFDTLFIVRDTLVPTADEWTRPWARIEERVVKPLMKYQAPWFEIYARRGTTG